MVFSPPLGLELKKLIFAGILVDEREVSHSSSTRSSAQRHTPMRAGTKRKRTMMEESHESSVSDYSVSGSSKGEVEIVDADPEGKYVKIHNKSNQEVSLGKPEIASKKFRSNSITSRRLDSSPQGGQRRIEIQVQPLVED